MRLTFSFSHPVSWLGVLVTTVGLASAFACSSQTVTYVDEPVPAAADGGFDSAPSPESGLGELTFMPDKSYSGFDGTHTFKVPVAVYDSGDDLEVTSTTPGAVEIVPKKLTNPVHTDGTVDNGKYFLVTIKQSGTIKLQAKSNGKTATSTIAVTEYAPGRWEAGEARYQNGPDADNPPCTTCHVQGKAIDHSPAALATATDEKIAVVITTGISTGGFPIKIDGQPGHQWKVTDTERDGLVTYLRGLEPKGFK